MKKINKGLLQTGLVIGIASIIVAGLAFTKFKDVININSIIASVINEPCNEYWATDCKSAHDECAIKANGIHQCKWVKTGFTIVQGNIRCPGKCVNGHDPIIRPTPTPVPTRTPRPTRTPTPRPTRTPRPTVTSTPTGTPRIVSCNRRCNSSVYPPINCAQGLFCYTTSGLRGADGVCRNINCRRETDCDCGTPRPTATPTGTPIPTSTPTMTATPTSVPGEPNYCGGTCGSNYNCRSGFFCYDGYCRNPQCANEVNCDCKVDPTTPPVLGISTVRELPKTGGGLGFITFSSLLGGLGFWLFKKSK